MAKVIVAFSGGKDSEASLLWAVDQYGVKNIEAVFCDTGWENPITYNHIISVCEKLGVKLVTVRSKKYSSLIDLAEKRKRFPSTRARFCTSELKTIPMIDYILSQEEHLIIIQGIRALESSSRSKMLKECRFFKYYFEPYKSNEKIVEELESRDKLTPVQKRKLTRAKNRLAEGKNDEKFHDYRKEDVIAWTKKYSDDIMRPVFDWTGQQVIDYILSKGHQPNELYKQGFKRVGCFPCIMSGHQEVYQIMKRYPEKFDEIRHHEERLQSSFFKIDFLPEKYRSGVCPRTSKVFTTIDDIEKYLTAKNLTIDMFEDEAISCSSYYHLCE